ncbi:MAG: AAA family ATPase, partial [Bdellovibrionaceae bacterium]|nr:AAA family ATPase [Pseudobdellovibrionaceae bacterium]
MIFSGGFPRKTNESCLVATQKTIYHVQKNMENVISATYPERVLLCDRGTVDGSAYWPESHDDFFKQLKTTKEKEFARYDAVIFFESAAVGGDQIEGGNPARVESLAEAAILDEKLRKIWCEHPNFHLIRHQKSFFKKITKAINLLNKIIHNGHKK